MHGTVLGMNSRTTASKPAPHRSPRWWGGTIAGLAGAGFLALLGGAFGGIGVLVVAGLGACTAALLMAMRWQ